MTEKVKLVIFVPTTLNVEDVLRIVAGMANRKFQNGAETFIDTAMKFDTLKFEGAFGHHSFFRNIEKANAIYTIDAEEITPSFIGALDKIQETICPQLYSFMLQEYEEVS